jgi:hypothetical protein
MNLRSLATVAVALLLATGCKKPESEERLTGAEALEATQESSMASSAQGLTAGHIEVTTDFTIGEGVEKAAENIAAFWRNQAPCAEVSLSRATVTVDYGAKSDNCVWRGRTFSGAHAVTVGRAEEAGIQVTHTWTEFSDGFTTISGEATVDWQLRQLQRTVTHDLSWTGANGRTGSGTGARTQSLIDPAQGLAGGINVDGDNSWTGHNGETWVLTVENVEIRAEDPVPQEGTYRLESPKGKSLTLSFSRVDADAIEVTLTGPRGKSFSFTVRRAGGVQES